MPRGINTSAAIRSTRHRWNTKANLRSCGVLVMTIITAKLPTTASTSMMSIAHSAKDWFRSTSPRTLATGEVTFEIFGRSETEDTGRSDREVFQERLGVTGRSMRGWDKEGSSRGLGEKLRAQRGPYVPLTRVKKRHGWGFISPMTYIPETEGDLVLLAEGRGTALKQRQRINFVCPHGSVLYTTFANKQAVRYLASAHTSTSLRTRLQMHGDDNINLWA
ncbi:hypothetical protein EYF80_006886 [Liparis tanakae]|uniref:Uncharacterized protein n=1 Tax=Liparis tanakae TaxID=230148 RepID=A0A4Z2IY72_9TELE|nr:hypothetical protein EYF80_006886 [Liparis tanakae]